MHWLLLVHNQYFYINFSYDFAGINFMVPSPEAVKQKQKKQSVAKIQLESPLGLKNALTFIV